MWLWEKIKTFTNKNPSVVRLTMVNEFGNGFYTWNGQLYKSDLIRSCIRPFYKAVGKLQAQQVRTNTHGEIKINPDAYVRILLEEPNPYMTGQLLQEKMAIQLKLNNNAFAYILRDDFGFATEIYPLSCVAAEAKYDENGYLFILFTLKNGKTMLLAYSDVIHLRQDYSDDDVFGASNREMFMPLMNIIGSTDRGIVNAIKNSACIRWLLKYKNVMKPEDVKKNTDDFVKSFLSVDNSEGAGAAAVDGKMDAEQVKPQDYVPNASQTDRTVRRIYSLFGTNENIVQSKYDENGWNAYYESEIEPVAIQLSNEFSRKIFSSRERAHGNRIAFAANSLQYASMSTKLQLSQMVDRGAMTPNEWRAVLNMGVIEGGDKAIRRKDTGTVKEVKKSEENAE